MYCAYDKNKNIIAFHDKRRVVEKYIDSIFKLHHIELILGKIKKSSKYKLIDKDELYLIRYGNTYVQSGYLIYIELSQDQFIEDEQYATDVLYRLLETSRLTDKQSKKIEKAIKVMEDILKEDREFIPSFNTLEELKLNYDPYIYNTGLYEKW